MNKLAIARKSARWAIKLLKKAYKAMEKNPTHKNTQKALEAIRRAEFELKIYKALKKQK